MILVDTNVISETARRSPTPSVLTFLLQHPVVGLSAVSVLELEAGVRAAPAPQARKARFVARFNGQSVRLATRGARREARNQVLNGSFSASCA